MMNNGNEKSDVGNFYDILEQYSQFSQRELSFLTGNWTDVEQWKTMARARVFELLNYFPESAPMNSEIVEVKYREGYRQEEIEFNAAKNVRVKGTMLIPDGDKTYPTIIALHDHGDFYYFGREKIIEQDNEHPSLKAYKKQYYGNRSWANEAVKRGYIVLSIDGFYFGSRKMDVGSISTEILQRCPYVLEGFTYESEEYIQTYNKICGYLEALLVKHIFISGATWPGMLFHDDRRCIDYLYTRKEVDRKRIGCCGLSMGGFRSAHLAALDSRISCSVVTGWMPTYDSLLFNGLRDHTYIIYIPGITRHMDLPDVVSLTAPNPLLVQQCSKDDLYNMKGMQDACLQIGEVYKNMGLSEEYKSQFYDGPHEFNVEMQEDALAWFDRWFKN